MEIRNLEKTPEADQTPKLETAFSQFHKLLEVLRGKELTDEVVMAINVEVDKVNATPNAEKELRKQLRASQTKIIKVLEKKMKLVTKNHHRNLWMILGMSIFGIPFGLVFSLTLGSMAFLGIGLPIGMGIGLALGVAMDAQAQKEGRQLDFQVK